MENMIQLTAPMEMTAAEAPIVNRPKKIYAYTRTEALFAFLMIVLAFMMVKLVFSTAPGLGVSIFAVSFVTLFVIWIRRNGLLAPRITYCYLALFLLLSTYFTLFNNPLFAWLALIILGCLAVYSIVTAHNQRLSSALNRYLLFDLADGMLRLPFGHFGSGIQILTHYGKNTKNARSILFLLIGILIAIPLTMIVVTLLQSADAAFTQLWAKLLPNSFASIAQNLLQLALSLPIACYLFALLYGAKHRDAPGLVREQQIAGHIAVARFLPALLTVGAITPVILVYLLFFFSQSAYFLSAFSGLLPEGFIYADYARRGFFELCTVSGINLGLLVLIGAFSKNTGAGKRILKIYGMILCSCSLVFIIISLSKMLLYIQSFGLTPLRVYTSWFMLFLLFIFVFAACKLLRSAFDAVKWSTLVGITMFMILLFANSDMQIARYNVHQYAAGNLEQLDVQTLVNLGDAATPYLIEAAEMDTLELHNIQLAHDTLSWRYQYRSDYQNDWRSFNLSHYWAMQDMAEYFSDKVISDRDSS